MKPLRFTSTDQGARLRPSRDATFRLFVSRNDPNEVGEFDAFGLSNYMVGFVPSLGVQDPKVKIRTSLMGSVKER